MRIISIFGRDFRLRDNPLFDGWREQEIIPLFLIDKFNQTEHGDNLKTLFFEYLKDFSKNINSLGSHLYIASLENFQEFLIKSRANVVRYSFDGEANTQNRGAYIEEICKKNNIKFIPLWNFMIKPARENFRYRFTDFYKRIFLPSIKTQNLKELDTPLTLKTPKIDYKDEKIPEYNKKDYILKLWFKDEETAIRSFKNFLSNKLSDYHINKDFPAYNGTSRLSPYLRCGIISLKTAYLMAKDFPNSECLIREIAWAEYYRIWLTNFPHVTNQEFRQNWIGFPWKKESELFEKWKRGETGFDIVDAGMHQLHKEGWMHNRVRMIVASFLTKNLLTDWRLGERFFYENLVDADIASNVGNWQWVAGCGLDAAPYFRIFNPELQAKKFDPEGIYISRYLTEKHPKIVDLQGSRIKFSITVREYQSTQR